jgi:hypothetical protein
VNDLFADPQHLWIAVTAILIAIAMGLTFFLAMDRAVVRHLDLHLREHREAIDLQVKRVVNLAEAAFDSSERWRDAIAEARTEITRVDAKVEQANGEILRIRKRMGWDP